MFCVCACVHNAILSLALWCVIWGKNWRIKSPINFDFSWTACPKMFPAPTPPILKNLIQIKNGKHYRWGDGQAVRSWDCYLKINHRGPEMGLGCFRRISHEISRSAYWGKLALLWSQLCQEFYKIISHLWQNMGKRGRKYMTCYQEKHCDLICFKWGFCLLGENDL